jgi:predicted dehydrogenase
VKEVTTRYEEICADPDVDAVIIATPNLLHRPISLEAIRHGKHVLCEKPLGLNAGEVRQMYQAARDRGVVHMTAFTYRFAPALKYLKHLLDAGQLGQPRHFRSQRFLDWPESSWGWRQYQHSAGAGDLFDMTIHRIDFAIDLLGKIQRVTGAVARFAERSSDPAGQSCPPSDVDDWSSLIGEFACGAVGVWEGTTLAKGHHHGGVGHEWAEINGSEGTAVYRLHEPNTILIGGHQQDLEPIAVPEPFLKPPGSPRDPGAGEPATVFRYDLMWEFVSAIVEQRRAAPDFYDGLQAQLVADAVLDSYRTRAWVEIPEERRE